MGARRNYHEKDMSSFLAKFMEMFGLSD